MKKKEKKPPHSYFILDGDPLEGALKMREKALENGEDTTRLDREIKMWKRIERRAPKYRRREERKRLREERRRLRKKAD